MKAFALVSVILLTIINQTIAQTSPELNTTTESTTTTTAAPPPPPATNFSILYEKVSTFDWNNKLNTDFLVLTFNKLYEQLEVFPTPERVLDRIRNTQIELNNQLHACDKQYFVNDYMREASKTFDQAYTKANRLMERADPIFYDLNVLIDTLNEKQNNCEQIPREEFQAYFECNQDIWRTVYPGLRAKSDLPSDPTIYDMIDGVVQKCAEAYSRYQY